MKDLKSLAEVLHLVKTQKMLELEDKTCERHLFLSVWKFILCVLKNLCVCTLMCVDIGMYISQGMCGSQRTSSDVSHCYSVWDTLFFFPPAAACTRLAGPRTPREGFHCLHFSSPPRSTEITGACTCHRTGEIRTLAFMFSQQVFHPLGISQPMLAFSCCCF